MEEKLPTTAMEMARAKIGQANLGQSSKKIVRASESNTRYHAI